MQELTNQEEEAMLVIWKLKKAFVKEVLAELKSELPYTTLASTIKKLEQKGYVQAEKLGNAKRYFPLISEKNYKRKFIKTLVGDYFKDSYKEMVNFFVEEKKLTREELEEIIGMITEEKDC